MANPDTLDRVSGAETVDVLINLSSKALKEITEDLEEIVKLDQAEERYLNDQRFTPAEKQRIQDLKGKVITIEEGLANEHFDDYGSFLKFIDHFSGHIIEVVRNELILEAEVMDRENTTKEDLLPEHRELLIRINSDALEILNDLYYLAERIEEFSNRTGVTSSEILPVLRDIRTLKSSIETSKDVLMDSARELGIEDELNVS